MNDIDKTLYSFNVELEDEKDNISGIIVSLEDINQDLLALNTELQKVLDDTVGASWVSFSLVIDKSSRSIRVSWATENKRIYFADLYKYFDKYSEFSVKGNIEVHFKKEPEYGVGLIYKGDDGKDDSIRYYFA